MIDSKLLNVELAARVVAEWTESTCPNCHNVRITPSIVHTRAEGDEVTELSHDRQSCPLAQLQGALRVLNGG